METSTKRTAPKAVDPKAGHSSRLGTDAHDSPTGLTVAVRNVSRSFGEVQALNDLTIEVPTGRITVLLGPNGAGKTTAIRTITGALAPHEGTVQVFGVNPLEHGENVRSRCGVVSANPALYDRLSGWHNLDYAADLYEVTGDKEAKIRSAAARFGIEHALDLPVGGYSTGMKTRLALSRSVLHEPELLLFDEPTSGLDPESAHAVLGLIREMTANGTTVVMCTHHLAEAEGLADRIVMLDGGRDLIGGAPADLMGRFWPQAIVNIRCDRPGDVDTIRGMPGVLSTIIDDDGTSAEVRLDDLDRTPEIIAALTGAGVRITKVEPFEPSLEDLYFAVRQEARQDGLIEQTLTSQQTGRAESASSEPETNGLSDRGVQDGTTKRSQQTGRAESASSEPETNGLSDRGVQDGTTKRSQQTGRAESASSEPETNGLSGRGA